MKVIRIGAMWCPGCIIMKKKWKEIEEKHPEIEFEDLDFDMDEEEVNKYNVGDTLPVAIVFENDTEVNRLIGEKDVSALYELIGE